MSINNRDTPRSVPTTRDHPCAAWDRMNRNGITGWRTAGENIAYGYPSARDVQEGWMNSPGHRENILNAGFTHVGVGLYVDSEGTAYWTQLFASF